MRTEEAAARGIEAITGIAEIAIIADTTAAITTAAARTSTTETEILKAEIHTIAGNIDQSRLKSMR